MITRQLRELEFLNSDSFSSDLLLWIIFLAGIVVATTIVQARGQMGAASSQNLFKRFTPFGQNLVDKSRLFHILDMLADMKSFLVFDILQQ